MLCPCKHIIFILIQQGEKKIHVSPLFQQLLLEDLEK